jgi:hypothetical protein
MHHSAGCANTRCLRRSVRPYPALSGPEHGTVPVTCGFTGSLDQMQR